MTLVESKDVYIHASDGTDIYLRYCLEGDITKIKNYVEKDHKNPYLTDNLGRNALFYAIWGNHIEVIKYLMKVAPGIPLLLTKDNTTTIQCAVVNGSQDIIMEVLTPPSMTSAQDTKLIKQKTIKFIENTYNSLLPPIDMLKSRNDIDFNKFNEFMWNHYCREYEFK